MLLFRLAHPKAWIDRGAGGTLSLSCRSVLQFELTLQQAVRDHRGWRLGQSNPGEVRLLVCKQTGKRIDQPLKGGPCLQTTRLFERPDALHLLVARGTGGPQRTFAPRDSKEQGALGTVVGRLDAMQLGVDLSSPRPRFPGCTSSRDTSITHPEQILDAERN